MFRLDPNPTFEETVHITEPGGGARPLKVVFRHKTKSQLNAFVANDKQGDLDMAMEIVEAVPESGGKPLREFFEALFENFPAAPLDLYVTYRRALTESRAKN